MKKKCINGKLSDVKLEYLKKYLKGSVILDLGAGRCYYSQWLSEYNPLLRIIAVDWIDIGEPLAQNIEYLKVDLELRLPFEDQMFDTIIAFDIIEHIENEKQLFNELKRVCKKDGLIIGSVPHDDDKFLPAYNLTFYHRSDVTHKRYYVPDYISLQFNKLGFKMENLALHGDVNPQFIAEFFPSGMKFFVKKTIGLLRRIGLINSQDLKSDLFFVAKKGE